jgi:hypothetical protein
MNVQIVSGLNQFNNLYRQSSATAKTRQLCFARGCFQSVNEDAKKAYTGLFLINAKGLPVGYLIIQKFEQENVTEVADFYLDEEVDNKACGMQLIHQTSVELTKSLGNCKNDSSLQGVFNYVFQDLLNQSLEVAQLNNNFMRLLMNSIQPEYYQPEIFSQWK